ncbi:uncharacterized protein IUM83_10941 [Phytophthora cinnamomi]|uniref:uncharacterized protein n=1 Tax=Phytophthora cinnamomi TaxID=4785 RepID=UPI00355998FA|nr:hypothetical protein IUM83_10941 [Phytophthora cinnamomi]
MADNDSKDIHQNHPDTDNKHVHFIMLGLSGPEPDNKHQAEEWETPAVGEVTAVRSEKAPKRRRGQRLCRYFARGTCTDGEKCRFSHEKRPKKSKRRDGDKGSSATDANATSDHEKAGPAQQLEVSKSTRPEKREACASARARKCKFFARNKCRDGDKCKFTHETKNAKRDREEKPRRAVVVQLGVPTESAIMAVNEHSGEWSDEQQRALDLALKKYPDSMDKKGRWTSIANEVDGRTLNECIERFQLLCDLVRRGVDVTPGPVNPCENRDSRIIAPDERIAIETEPEAKGTQIRLEDLFLHKVGTLVAHRLVCQVQCDNCPLTFDAILSLDSTEVQKWCPRCSVLHHVVMRPVFAHTQSDVLAYVDTENCSIVDVLPSEMLATCLECGCEALHEKVAPRQRSEQACFNCHNKLAVMAKRFLAQLEGSSRKRSSSVNEISVKADEHKKGKQVTQNFVLGQPLPRNGSCDHYKHSLRWFRFQCCGKAFPCNVCHDLSDCPDANLGKLASRMLCGLCSKEQSSSIKVCACGNDVGSKRSTTHHWEGGTGCRNYTLMSRWDKQKHHGQNKTESTKFYRVGVEAKKRRENANNGDANPMVGPCCI